ncbi:MAG: NlpC/P60 family protein [Bacteroidales bacterium]
MEAYGICHLPVVPVRAEASERSEMVNQLLFGETFEITDAFRGWKLIRGTLDKYEGFIGEKQFAAIGTEDFKSHYAHADRFSDRLITAVKDEITGLHLHLLPGSSMRGFNEGHFRLGNLHFSCEASLSSPAENADRGKLVAFARNFLNAPYLWGGRSLFGIDCSGLVQVVFKVHGILMQRDASYQAQQGETLSLMHEAIPGDLAFFDNEEGLITHVGIISGEGTIIHASGQVREDALDHQGIFNRQLKKYTHKMRLLKRIIQ